MQVFFHTFIRRSQYIFSSISVLKPANFPYWQIAAIHLYI